MEGTQKNHQENAEKVKPFKLLHMHLPPKYYIRMYIKSESTYYNMCMLHIHIQLGAQSMMVYSIAGPSCHSLVFISPKLRWCVTVEEPEL